MPQLSINDQSLTVDALQAVHDSGCTAIDLRAGQGGQINWDKHLTDAQVLHTELIKTELQCAIIHTDVAIDDIDSIVKAVEVAHALNCEFITIAAPAYDGSIPFRSLLGDLRGCYQDLNQISSETGIDALIPLAAGSICPNTDAAMRILEGLDPSQVGVLFDPDTCTDQADVKRCVDVLGPFLRALSTADSASPALKTAISCLADPNIFVSVATPVAQAKAAIKAVA